MRGCILEINCEGLDGNWQYVCLPFCWSWPEGSDNFQKREDSRKWGDWFWNSGHRYLCTLAFIYDLITFFGSPCGPKQYGFLVISGCLFSRKVWWAVRIDSFCPKVRYFTEQTKGRTTWKWIFTIFKYKMNVTNIILLLFWWQKIAFKSPFDL